MKPLHERKDEILARLANAKHAGRCGGAMMLATCNRFEVVLDLADADVDELRAEIFAGIDVPLDTALDAKVVQHLVRVGAGLESLVLGEDQVIGQLSQAFRDAATQGLLSKRLQMVHSRVMHAARKARSSRPAVSAPRSVAELAARFARDAGPRVAIIGAGTTAHTAAESLRALGARHLHFANRTVANAARLASHFEGTSGSLDDLLLSPPDVDAIIVAISGRTLRLPVNQMPGLRTVIDISQPAIAVGLADHPQILHLDLDGLATQQQHREEKLERWRERAAAMAEQESLRIWEELTQGRVDLGNLLGLHVENATSEVERALRGRLSGLAPAQAEEVRKLAERVARRNAHLHLSDMRHYSHS